MQSRILFIWLFLVVLTVVSYALTDNSTLPWISGVILLLTAVKGWMIVDGFMELRGHQHLVRRAMNLYCPILGVLIWLLVK